jgi:hypothetical protein
MPLEKVSIDGYAWEAKLVFGGAAVQAGWKTVSIHRSKSKGGQRAKTDLWT